MKKARLLSTAFALLIAFAVCISFKPPGIKGLPSFTSIDMGNIKAGTTTIINDGAGLKLQGYGTMFGMHHGSDEGRFAYTKIKGDFDIIMQVDTVAGSGGSFTEGGIMVRKDLNPKGLMLANFVTNNNFKGETDQYTFMFRMKEGGSIEPYWNIIENFYGDHTFGNPGFGYSARGWSTNNLPARPFPYVWLRVIRQGSTYKAYRKFGSAADWGKWEKMSEITIDLGDEPLVGLALSANHHKLNPSGSIGDPNSISEIFVSKITLNE
jgi:hypothetical protein